MTAVCACVIGWSMLHAQFFSPTGTEKRLGRRGSTLSWNRLRPPYKYKFLLRIHPLCIDPTSKLMCPRCRTLGAAAWLARRARRRPKLEAGGDTARHVPDVGVNFQLWDGLDEEQRAHLLDDVKVQYHLHPGVLGMRTLQEEGHIHRNQLLTLPAKWQTDCSFRPGKKFSHLTS